MPPATKFPPLGQWLLVLLGVGLTGWATPALGGGMNSNDTIWPANGVLLAVLLRAPRAHWPAYLFAGAAATAAVSATAGDPPVVVAMIAALNAFEVVLGALLLRPRAKAFDLHRRADLIRLVAYGAGIAPAATAALAAASFARQPFQGSFLGWYVPDALGIATVTPFALELVTGKLKALFVGRELWPSIGVLALVTVVTTLTFSQGTYPLLFVGIPFLVLAAYRLGFSGAAAGALIVAFISIGLTFHDRGPMASIPDLHTRVRILQLFVATALATSLPFALLLDERRRLERAVASSEAQHRLLFEQVGEAILLYPIGPDGTPGTFVRVNEEACHYLGYTRDELLARTPGDLQAPENTVGLDSVLASMSQGTARVDRIHLAKDGRRIPVEVSAHRVEIGGEAYCLTIVRDVTARRRLEAQLRQAERVESLGQLAGGVAHDFNNVLTAVMGYAQLVEARARAGRPVDLDDVAQIRLAAERAVLLTRQLLAFSRPQLGDPRDVDLSALVHEMRRFLERLASASVTLAVRTPSEPMVVRADPGQLQQIVLNLVVNARDAMPDGGTVTLAIGAVDVDADPELASGRYVLLSATDTGSGMTADVIAQIFEPFFTTKAPGKGTGIGLPTVQRIVATAKGAVRVESSPGKGTTFRIYLPRQNTAATTVHVPERPPAAPVERSGIALLVEDDDAIRALTKRTLDEAGFRVIEARHVAEALALLGDPRPSLALVVTDLVMPGGSGKELLRALRATQPLVPAIVVSGYATDDLGDLADGGARHRFLAKPFTQQALLAAADELRAPVDPRASLRGARVLVVDDDPVIQSILRHFLEGAGVECRWAESGAEGMDALRRDGHVDAVLLDYELPDTTAPQLAGRIRSELGVTDVPIIAVTGHTSAENLAECLAAGMVDRVTKPIADGELTSTLARWLAHRGAGAST